jgi:hypothetical protein
MPSRGTERFTREERSILARLRRPEEIQRFLDEELLYNKEPEGETCRSPRRVIRDRVGHCAEGAFFAAAAIRFHGQPPLVLTLRAVRDDDHVLALFREKRTGGAWGAIAKSNYSGLRFREPVYRNLRELVMSYFEGYFNLSAEKTLRAFSGAVDLSRFDRAEWETREDDLWDVSEYLASRPMRTILTSAQIRTWRRVDRRLFEAGLVGRVLAGDDRGKTAARSG